MSSKVSMSAKQLRYFVAVADEEHFGRAAARLNVSQPPITRQIQELEKSLGVQLFVRHAKGVTLTMEGRLLLDDARTIMALMTQAAEKIGRARKGELGNLDVATFGSAVFGKITQIVLAFRHTYPEVNVVLHSMTKSSQYEALRNRSIDVAFNRMLTLEPGLIIEELLREPLYLAISEHCDLAAMEEVPFASVANYALILFPTSNRPGFVDKVKRLCADAGIVPNVAQEVGDPVTGLALVASGFGICFVPESLLSLSLPGVTFRPLGAFAGDLSVDLSCFYRSDNIDPVLRNFLEIARSICTS